MENVTEVMREVGDWKRVAQGSVDKRGFRRFMRSLFISGPEIPDFAYGLRIPDSKLREIKQRSYTKRDRRRLAGEYWVNTDPRASWQVLGYALYEKGEETAAAMVKQYLPKGMCIS